MCFSFPIKQGNYICHFVIWIPAFDFHSVFAVSEMTLGNHLLWFLSQAFVYRWMHFSHISNKIFHIIFEKIQWNDWQQRRPSVNKGGSQYKWCITLLSNLWAKSHRALGNGNGAEWKIRYCTYVQSNFSSWICKGVKLLHKQERGIILVFSH